MENKIYINQLQAGNEFGTFFLVKKASFALTKKGSEYGALTLSDKSGDIEARIWEVDPTLKSIIERSKFCYITGMVEDYKGSLQIKVSRFEDATDRASSDAELLQSMISASRYSVQEMWGDLVQIHSTMENHDVKSVAAEILLRQEWSELFKQAPAATGVHHAFIGGLLEHTVEMCKIGNVLLELPFFKNRLNRDLCLYGLMFHDFGKIFEYSCDPGFKKLPNGLMVGHISMLSAITYETCNRFEVAPIIRDHMMHVILAHHGKVEWGSPVTMVSPEAVFVHHVDHLHGDVMGMLQKLDQNAGKEIIEKDFIWKNFLGPQLRFSKCLEETAVQPTEGF